MSININIDGYALLNKEPAIAYVSPERIDNAIAAQFFHPERVKALVKIENSGIITKKFSDVANRKSERANAQNLSESYPYIGLSDIDSYTGFITPSSLEDIKGTCALFHTGDILYSKLRPYLNKVAICPDSIKNGVGSTELVVYTCKPSVNRSYIFAVVKSNIVLNQLIKITSGSTHPRVDPDFIDSALIPFPDQKIQEYIGQKISSAESCRNASSEMQVSLDSLLKELYQNVPLIDASQKQTTVTIDEFDNDRIDAWHYQRHYIDLNKWLKENTRFDRVSRFASLSKNRWSPKKETNPQFLYIEISNVDTSTCALSPNLVEVSNAPSRARKLLKSYDVLISTVRPNRGAISVVPKELNGAVASTGFAVIRTKSKEDAYFLGQILKHPISIAQLMRWNTGSTYPAIEEDVVLKIWVPGANEDLRKKIGELEMKRYWLQEKASKLVEEAKSDVEALIEGKLDTDAILSGKLKAPTWEDIEKELEGI
jgi:type I restriction enzyme S subunit